MDRVHDKMKHCLYCTWTSFSTKRTGGLPIGYTREERLDIGNQIYNNEISKSDAAIKYKISQGIARDHKRLYRDMNGLPPKNRIQKEENTVKISVYSSAPDLSEYKSMTKAELIKELVKSWIREARLKKDTK